MSEPLFNQVRAAARALDTNGGRGSEIRTVTSGPEWIMAGEQQLPCQDYKSYLSEPDESCKDFIMQQTMMRIKDPKRSLDFYTRVLGMRSGAHA